MFLPGQIIYFTSFQFKNGNTPKSKYFIVIAKVGNNCIIASLPTRTNSVPSFVSTDHGCINIDERCYNAYVFKKNQIIGQTGFSFDMPTFIYGDQVEDYQLEFLDSNYIDGIDYVIQDVLLEEELKAIVDCFKNSDSVKFKIKKRL